MFEGFTYRYQKALAGGEHRWKCDAPGAGAKCRGSARTKATEDGLIATVSTEHSHGPAPPASLEAARIRQALKEDVLANPTKSIQAATAHALQPASEFALARLRKRQEGAMCKKESEVRKWGGRGGPLRGQFGGPHHPPTAPSEQ